MNSRGLRELRTRASRSVRIGQRLVAEGLLSEEQLQEALSAQVERRERLGSILLQLGYLDADVLARCLGRWYGMPPALEHDFARCDLRLAKLLPRTLAAEHGVVPLGLLDDGLAGSAVVAVMDPPSAPALQVLESSLKRKIVPAIAASVVLQHCLRRLYGVAPTGRAAEIRMAPPLEFIDEDPLCELSVAVLLPPAPATADLTTTAPAAPARQSAKAISDSAIEMQQEIELDLEADVDDTRATGDHQRISGFVQATAGSRGQAHGAHGQPGASAAEGAVEQEEITARRRSYTPPPTPVINPARGDAGDQQAIPALMPENDSSRSTNPFAITTLGRIAIRRLGTAPLPGAEDSEFVPTETLEDVTRAIRQATGRDRVAELTIGAVDNLFDGIFDVGTLLTIRGVFAVGWRGFVRAGHNHAAESLTLPLRAPSAIADACEQRRPYVGAVADGGTEMDRRMWTILDVPAPATVAIAPLLLDTDEACVLYAHSALDPEAAAAVIGDSFHALAGATAAAFERLARAADR